MTAITKLKAALDLADAQWKCSRLWSMEEAQDVAEGLRSVIAEMEAGEPIKHSVGTLIDMSYENFLMQFGSSKAADWIYNDLHELLEGYEVAQPKAEPNEWKEAMMQGLVDHAIDAPITDTPSEILSRIIDMAVTIATDPSMQPKAEPVAWVWNPAKEAWEQVHMFGNWQQGAIYAFGPTIPAQPKAEPRIYPGGGEVCKADLESQPNQYGIEFGMSGANMTFKIGNQRFTLDYEPDTDDEFTFMQNMLMRAMSHFTPSVKTTVQPKAEPVYLVEDDFGLFRITDKADYTYWSSTGRHKTFIANVQPKAEPVQEPTGVFGFLLGRNALDGAWYGDIPDGKTRYWWRQALIEAMGVLSAAPQAATVREPVGHAYTIAGIQHVTITEPLEDGPLYAAPKAKFKPVGYMSEDGGVMIPRVIYDASSPEVRAAAPVVMYTLEAPTKGGHIETLHLSAERMSADHVTILASEWDAPHD